MMGRGKAGKEKGDGEEEEERRQMEERRERHKNSPLLLLQKSDQKNKTVRPRNPHNKRTDVALG
jgi:hypothetical protein